MNVKTLSQWLKTEQLAKRLVIGLIFVASLTLFLYFREDHIDIVQLNKQTDRYIVAQTDFEFPDEEATLILRQESLRGVGSIFKIDTKEGHKLRKEVEKKLAEERRSLDEAGAVSFEELHKAAKAIEKGLHQIRFAEPRTIKKVDSQQPSIDKPFFLLSGDPKTASLLPKEVWAHVEKWVLASGKVQKETLDTAVRGFKDRSWRLEEDYPLERTLKQSILSQIAPVMTKVEAGSHIIDPGERVTPRHIAMISAMKVALGETKERWDPIRIFGSLLLSLTFMTLVTIYLRLKHPAILDSIQKLALLTTIVVFTLGFSKGAEYLLLNQAQFLIDVVRYPLFIPLASFLVCVLVGTEVALFTSGFLAITLAFSLAVDNDRFLVINLVAAFVIILCARRMLKRKEVFAICGKVWLCSIPVLLAFNCNEEIFWNFSLLTDVISTFLFMLCTAILVVGLLPILESLFNVMTDMTLMEYMDPNNELVRRLSLEAPGTYQHSLVVGNLAEAASHSVNANGLFCRVSTLYHDIGKLVNPHYFTENQLGGFNIHPLLTPAESAQVITAHVTEGENLARRHRLPESFIDIIREHHGTTLVTYFYHKELESVQGDHHKVVEKHFRYHGPKPRSKESAIIMIADSVEAASRSLEEVSEQRLASMVDALVAKKMEDGQFDECPLSFEELGVIKKAMIKTLLVSSHLRVKYPGKSA